MTFRHVRHKYSTQAKRLRGVLHTRDDGEDIGQGRDQKDHQRLHCAAIPAGEDPESLTDEAKLFTDGILDLLASLKLVSFLEERFSVTIDAHEVDVDHLDKLDTIADMVIAKRG